MNTDNPTFLLLLMVWGVQLLDSVRIPTENKTVKTLPIHEEFQKWQSLVATLSIGNSSMV
jgi:hypothetical protein